MTEPTRVIVSTAELRRAVRLAAPYSAIKNPLPICANVRMTSGTAEHTLVLEATDLDQAIRTSIAVNIGGGSISACVPAKALKTLVEGLKSETHLELEADGSGALTVRAGAKVSEFKGMKPDDFPAFPLPDDSERHVFAIEADALKRLAARTAFAASKEDTRPVLRGVHLESSEMSLVATATNGFRLASASEENVSGADLKMTVPAKALKLAASSVEGVVYATTRAAPTGALTQILLSTGGTTIAIRLIEGTYPNYRQIIPKDNTFKASVRIDAGELLAAVKSATAGAKLTAKDTQGSMNPQEPRVRIEADQWGSIRIASEDADGNEFAARADAHVTGQFMAVGFQPAYLVDAVKALVGGITTGKAATIATTTVTAPPSHCIPSERRDDPVPVAPHPEPTAKAVDPMVARAALESARLRLGVTERLFGQDSPQARLWRDKHLAAQARLQVAGTAQTNVPASGGTGAVVSQPVCEPPRVRPTVVRRSPDPAAMVPAGSGSTITLSFTGPNSACLIRGATEASGTHVIMPMVCDTGKKARDERAA